ncbi:MAG: T9SS type A sorting domain-containing protein, partial [Saprospiraceae bacterium]
FEKDIPVLLYPNPTHGELFIRANNRESGPIDLQLFDLRGQLLYSTKLEENEINDGTLRMDIRGWAKGMYLLKLSADGQTEMLKVILL